MCVCPLGKLYSEEAKTKGKVRKGKTQAPFQKIELLVAMSYVVALSVNEYM